MAARRSTFGSTRKLPSGRWQARYYEADGLTRRSAPVTFDTRADANAWLAVTQADISRGIYSKPEDRKARTQTLAVYADKWLADRDIKPRTRAHYRDLLDRHILPQLGSVRLKAITTEAVNDWYAVTAINAPTIRAHSYALLRTMLSTAVSDGALPANPARIRSAGQSKRIIDIEPASLDELERLVAAMPERYRLLTLLAAWTALRFGELAELRVDDIDTVKGTVRVRRGVVRAKGKKIVGTPKSGAGKRDVAIPPHLMPMVRQHLAGMGKADLLFPSSTGAQLVPSTLYRSWYPARKAAGRPDLRWHDLRHTGAVLAASTGATLAELMARLGHSTPAAALRYQHAAQGRDAAIAVALSEIAAAQK